MSSFSRPSLAAMMAAFMVLASSATALAGDHWSKQAVDVGQAIAKAEDTFLKGDVAQAKRDLTEAYFHHFEDSKLEAAVRRFISAKRAAEVEKMFGDMRKAMTGGNAAEVKRLGAAMREAVVVDAKTLDSENVAPGVFEVNQ